MMQRPVGLAIQREARNLLHPRIWLHDNTQYTYRRRRRDSTVELSCVGGVYIPVGCRDPVYNSAAYNMWLAQKLGNWVTTDDWCVRQFCSQWSRPRSSLVTTGDGCVMAAFTPPTPTQLNSTLTRH